MFELDEATEYPTIELISVELDKNFLTNLFWEDMRYFEQKANAGMSVPASYLAPSYAYEVICDARNNTPQTMSQNELHVRIMVDYNV
jgi:hypothetical protein